ncbi:hypothetical protein J6590_069433 [Homalodisca vitripennis]|nr:hypothetical protein J6590_069433 [Homalodisca vitripennis]
MYEEGWTRSGPPRCLLVRCRVRGLSCDVSLHHGAGRGVAGPSGRLAVRPSRRHPAGRLPRRLPGLHPRSNSPLNHTMSPTGFVFHISSRKFASTFIVVQRRGCGTRGMSTIPGEHPLDICRAQISLLVSGHLPTTKIDESCTLAISISILSSSHLLQQNKAVCLSSVYPRKDTPSYRTR